MNTTQQNNSKLLIDSLNKFGVTNTNLQAGILATIYKESNFIPQSENLNYTYEDIKRVWPKTPDNIAKDLAHNPQKLADYMYGSKGGNGENEGYKYRGRGFNQITFKGNYDKFGKAIGQDLVSNPDLLNDPKIAADAAAAFFSQELKNGQNAGSFKKFGVDNVSSIADTLTATKVAVQINAGRGTSFDNAVVQEGFKKASSQVDSLLEMIEGYSGKAISATINTVKNNPIITSIIAGVTVIGIYYLFINKSTQII